MKKLLYISFLFISLFAKSQVQPAGTVLGFQTVINLPIVSGTGTTQALIYFPQGYFAPANSAKKYALFVFLHGAGEGTTNNITQVLNQSLPYLISQGLDPYGIDSVTADTVRFIVVSPHAANTSFSYSGPDVRTLTNGVLASYRVDTTQVFIGGLSAGGYGAWSMFKTFRSVPSCPVTGIVPLSGLEYTAGTDAQFNTAMSSGRSLMAVCGNQDALVSVQRTYLIEALANDNPPPQRVWSYEVPSAGHDSSVWNPIFRMNNRWLNPTKNIWDLMANIRVGTPAVGTLAANAGPDQVIQQPATSGTLSGSGTTPTGTTITGYGWTRISGPNTPTITTPAGQSTTITGLIAGTYVFRLTITNNLSNTATDDVQVIVNPQPTVSAGPNQTITLPTSSVTMAGSSSKSGGSIASNLWTKVSGPSTFVITTPSSLTTTITGLTSSGVYTFMLTATDNLGNTNSGTMTVTVNSSTRIHVTKIATTEYVCDFLYSDSTVKSYAFNAAQNKTLFQSYNTNSKRIIDLATGFNRTLFIDEDHKLQLKLGTSETAASFITTDTLGNSITDAYTVAGAFYVFTFARSTDSSLWYYGNNDYNFFVGTNPITKPLQISPTGMKIKKVVMGPRKILVLTTNGQVWEVKLNGGLNWVQWTLPRPAIDICNGYYDYSCAIVPNAVGNGSQIMGYPYFVGTFFTYWGGSALATTSAPFSTKTLWGSALTYPVKKIVSSSNIITYIDSMGRRFSIGDDGNGEAGNGDELYDKQEASALPGSDWVPYQGSWRDNQYMTGTVPIQVGVATTWKDVYASSTFNFYVWATDTNDSTWFNGRNKSLVGAVGFQYSNESSYSNALDVVTPVMRTPLANQPVTFGTFVKYTLFAGQDRIINSTTTILTATGIPSTGDTIKSYQWFKLSGPGTPVLATPNSYTTSVTGLTTGVYAYRVQMTDGRNGTISDTLLLTVSLPTTNLLPNVVIHPPTPTNVIQLPAESYVLDGSLSADPDGDIVSYLWENTSSIPSTTQGNSIINPTAPITLISSLAPGVFIYKLTCVDNSGGSVSKFITITIKEAITVIPRLRNQYPSFLIKSAKH